MASNNGVIEIPGGQDLVAQPKRTVNVSEVNILRVICIPKEKMIRARIKEVAGQITLYEGAAYDALNGVISMEDVETRVKEELGIGSSS